MQTETFHRVVLPLIMALAAILLFVFRKNIVPSIVKSEQVVRGMWLFEGKGKTRYAKFILYSLIFVLSISAVIYPFADFDWHKFESEAWKKGESLYENIPPRSSMVSDLLSKYHELEGMSKLGVINLLGEPSLTEDNDIFYWIGAGYKCFFPDLDAESWLRIRFENDKAVQAKILKDCGGHGFNSVKDK